MSVRQTIGCQPWSSIVARVADEFAEPRLRVLGRALADLDPPLDRREAPFAIVLDVAGEALGEPVQLRFRQQAHAEAARLGNWHYCAGSPLIVHGTCHRYAERTGGQARSADEARNSSRAMISRCISEAPS
jgi:hypothetical protein